MCFVVVDLMDWHGRVDDVRFNSLLVDDRLNRLVYMMMHMFALDALVLAESLLAFCTSLRVLVSCALVLEATLDFVGVVVFERSSLNWRSLVMVLLGQDLRVVHRLLRGVIVVLVHLTIDSGRRLLVLPTSDSLVLHGRCYCLVDCCVMFARLGPEHVDQCRSRSREDCLLT